MRLFGLFYDPDRLILDTERGPRRTHKIEVHFKWVDMWVGAFWDRDLRTLWVCPFPMLAIRILFGRAE